MSLSTKDTDKGAKRIKRQLKKLDGGIVSIGVHEGAGKYESGISVSDVAFFQEFGTESIPETPFIRSSVDTKKTQINKKSEDLLNNVINGSMSAKKALDALGFYIQGLIQNRITKAQDWAEPLEPSTAARKVKGGSLRGPVRLIDSGLLLRSITFETEV